MFLIFLGASEANPSSNTSGGTSCGFLGVFSLSRCLDV